MHILIIPSWYSTNTNPTMGSFFKEQAVALKKSGFKVTVAYPGFLRLRDSKNEEAGFKFSLEDGVPTYRYDTFNYGYDRLPINLKPILFKRKVFKLYNIIEQKHGKPDIIHAHSCFWAGYGAVSLGIKKKIPVVLTEHSSAYSIGNISILNKRFIYKPLQFADKVVAVSEGLKRDVERYASRNDIEIIPNIVDTEKFKIESNCRSNEKFTFLAICNLYYLKGIDILLKAFESEFKGKNIKLKIGGEGPERASLEQLTIELGIEDQVDFLGLLSRSDVVKQMQQCDAFVLPSRNETFGVVLIEALACGKPIIATKTGGPDSIVNNINGYLVEVGNVDKLAAALKYVYTNIDNYRSDLIRNDCMNRFSEKKVIEKLNNIYLSII